MSKPTQEQIAKAQETLRQWGADVPYCFFNPTMECDDALRIMDDAYRSEHDRAELLERQYDELIRFDPAGWHEESWADILDRHAREREALND